MKRFTCIKFSLKKLGLNFMITRKGYQHCFEVWNLKPQETLFFLVVAAVIRTLYSFTPYNMNFSLHVIFGIHMRPYI